MIVLSIASWSDSSEKWFPVKNVFGSNIEYVSSASYCVCFRRIVTSIARLIVYVNGDGTDTLAGRFMILLISGRLNVLKSDLHISGLVGF